MKEKIGFKKWIGFILIGLAGQFAWSVENMYLNKFIFSFGSANYTTMITITVALSAITACLTTIFMGALSDKINKRKIFISGGYILWGLATASFGFVNINNVQFLFPTLSAASVASILVIILDCVMTFFGSTANDACFNSYVTREVSDKNRGKVEGVLSILPLVSMLIIFGGMNFLTDNGHWDIFFFIIGGIAFIVGIISIFLLPKEENTVKSNENYFKIIFDGFRIKTIKENKSLFLIFLGFLIYGIATQVFFPYLTIYFQYSLKLEGLDFTIALGSILVVGSILSVLSGILMDKIGKDKLLIPSVIIGIIGLFILYFVVPGNLVFAILAGIIMMFGYIFIGTVLNSKIRDLCPKNKEGIFMGVRMIFVVMLPMVTGPYIGQFITDNFATGTYVGEFGTEQKLPPNLIWLVSAIILVFALIPLIIYLIKNKKSNKNEGKNQGLLFPNEDKSSEDYVPLNEHPNPKFKRETYEILNGFWDIEVTKNNEFPNNYTKKILVPYALEVPLSEFNYLVEPEDFIYYHKRVEINKNIEYSHLFINFLGIDQVSEIYINKMLVAKTNSGYLPISVDIGPLIKKDDSYFDIEIKVQDVTDQSYYSRGKQGLNRGGIWYSSSSGIYKSVYLEYVSDHFIKKIDIDYDLAKSEMYLTLNTNINGTYNLYFNNKTYELSSNKKEIIKLENILLWSVDNPYLYDLLFKFEKDEVQSYIGFRKIELKNNENGVKRLFLNDKEVILKGVLDQGYYYQGNLTPKSYADYLLDIKNLKVLGFNTIRKHIKYEDPIFYYYADKLGILIIQDFVNGGQKYNFLTISYPALLPYKTKNVDLNYKKFKREHEEGRILFEKEADYWFDALKCDPSVIMFTIFNEGWGQFNSTYFYNKYKKLNPNVLLDTTSGWYDNENSDFYSKHIYFTKIKDFYKKDRASFLSEFGGYSLFIDDHFYGKDKFGYKMFKSKEEISKAYENLFIKQVIPTLKKHNIGFIYTQLSDVEDEVNGLYTFDRKILKIDENVIVNINKKVDSLLVEGKK